MALTVRLSTTRQINKLGFEHIPAPLSGALSPLKPNGRKDTCTHINLSQSSSHTQTILDCRPPRKIERSLAPPFMHLGPVEASNTLFNNTSLKGIGFWSPVHREGIQAQPPTDYQSDRIYLLEVLAVVATLKWAAQKMWPGEHLAIFTDNSNTVTMFYSICTLPLYNPLLIHAVDILILIKIELCVYHIPGHRTTVAGHLSC